MRKNIRGSGKTGCLIWLIILGAVFYVGYKFGAAQWAYLNMREDIHEIAKAAASQRTLNVEGIQQEVINLGEKLGISIAAEDIKIQDEENKTTIEVYWEVALEFPFYTYYQDYTVVSTQRKGL
ncbi:MAG: hypothetical protein MZU91_06720 [Desulfosudis oleivorans]|nr:hypothetical protein [Desulfosudis oleivorans]